jgi:hypothetical protein
MVDRSEGGVWGEVSCRVSALVMVLDRVEEMRRVSGGEADGVGVNDARQEVTDGRYTDHILGDGRWGSAEDP